MRRAFSLIELMIVIAIIAILASISLPLYKDYMDRAQITEAVALTETLKGRVKDYYLHSGRFPMNNKQAGIPEPDKLIGNHVESITLTNGALHVEIGNKAGKSLQGKILTIRPIVVIDSPSSPMSWIGGFSDVPKGMKAIGENLTDIDPTMLPYPFRSHQAKLEKQ